MARNVALVAFGVVIGIFGAAAAGIHADDEVDAAALEAGVDPVLLAGAVATTGVGPREYLRGVGELMTGQTPAPPVPSIWQRLAACESTSRWNAATGNGYFGGLQMDMTFWRRYGGMAYASRPDLASPTAQVEIAQRGQRVQGWAAWPACSRRLGLR